MPRKLARKSLVKYIKYKPLSLTNSGLNMALNVIRKHRLWETFLYHTLGLSLHEIHREAEHLVHQTSDFLAEKIEHYLGHPSTDPHGDPIPTLNGEIEPETSQWILSEAEEGKMYEISRLFSSDKDFYDFCSTNHIAMGANIWVEKQYQKNRMTEVKISENKILLNQDFANIIYVKQKDAL